LLRGIECHGIEAQTIHHHEKGQLENREENLASPVALVLRDERLPNSLHGLGIDDLHGHLHQVQVEKVRSIHGIRGLE
jgi:hypothetical protein